MFTVHLRGTVMRQQGVYFKGSKPGDEEAPGVVVFFNIDRAITLPFAPTAGLALRWGTLHRGKEMVVDSVEWLVETSEFVCELHPLMIYTPFDDGADMLVQAELYKSEGWKIDVRDVFAGKWRSDGDAVAPGDIIR